MPAEREARVDVVRKSSRPWDALGGKVALVGDDMDMRKSLLFVLS